MYSLRIHGPVLKYEYLGPNPSTWSRKIQDFNEKKAGSSEGLLPQTWTPKTLRLLCSKSHSSPHLYLLTEAFKIYMHKSGRNKHTCVCVRVYMCVCVSGLEGPISPFLFYGRNSSAAMAPLIGIHDVKGSSSPLSDSREASLKRPVGIKVAVIKLLFQLAHHLRHTFFLPPGLHPDEIHSPLSPHYIPLNTSSMASF